MRIGCKCPRALALGPGSRLVPVRRQTGSMCRAPRQFLGHLPDTDSTPRRRPPLDYTLYQILWHSVEPIESPVPLYWCLRMAVNLRSRCFQYRSTQTDREVQTFEYVQRCACSWLELSCGRCDECFGGGARSRKEDRCPCYHNCG